MDHKIINFWTNFGPILVAILGQNWLQNGTKNGTTFGTLLLRLKGVRIMPKRKINESAAKATGAGIIFPKRKGGMDNQI